jgi:hypothetical protein
MMRGLSITAKPEPSLAERPLLWATSQTCTALARYSLQNKAVMV